MSEGEVFVLIAVAPAVRDAQVHEVGHELVDLVGVGVVREGERCQAHRHLVGDGSVKPLGGEELLEDRVEGLARRAQVVLEELDLDAGLALSLRPAGVESVDGRAVGGNAGGGHGAGKERLHSGWDAF